MHTSCIQYTQARDDDERVAAPRARGTCRPWGMPTTQPRQCWLWSELAEAMKRLQEAGEAVAEEEAGAEAEAAEAAAAAAEEAAAAATEAAAAAAEGGGRCERTSSDWCRCVRRT